MSQENVEIVRAAIHAWNDADMKVFRGFLDQNVVGRAPEDWPESGPFFGLEAVMRQFEQFRTTYESDAIEPISEFIDVGDRVVVRTVVRAVGRGPESALEWTYVFTVRKGAVLAIEVFWHHLEALEVVGLSEQDAHAD
jgi:ketosteroid isomerase-like protein